VNQLVDDFEQFLFKSIFSFNLTDIFFSILKVMNVNWLVYPILSEWDKKTIKNFGI